MKNNLKKTLFVATILCIVITSSVFVFGVSDLEEGRDGKFNVTVLDGNKDKLQGAKVFLYSFLDEKIVEQGVTNSEGLCSMAYKPELSFNSNDNYMYEDYMVYAVKEGYTEAGYNCTKMYVNPEVINDKNVIDSAAQNNIESETIEMQLLETGASNKFLEREKNVKNSTQDIASAKVYEHLVNENKLSEDNPFCVLKTKELEEMLANDVINQTEYKAINNINPMNRADYSMRNVQTPIGKFHVTKQGRVKVVFATSDNLKIDVGMKNTATGATSLSGSRTRGFGTTTEFGEFTTTNATAKRTYYTRADYETWTVVSYYGLTYSYVGISKIVGGGEWGAVSSCDTCGSSYSAVLSGYGSCASVPAGGSHTVTQYRNKTVSLGLSVPIATFNVDLGVTRITGASISVKYLPKTGYKLRIYNKDTNTWHCTQTAS